MNGFERIDSALKGIMPDKRPVMLHCFMLAVQEAGYNMHQYRSDAHIAAECHIRFVEKYDLDGVLFDVDTALMADAIGCPVDFPLRNPARVCNQFLNSLDDVDRLREVDISRHPRIQHSLEAMRLLREHFGHEVYLRGNCDQAPFSLACCMRSPGQFMMDLLLEPEKAKRLIDYTTRRCVQMIELMAQVGVDMVSNGDSPAGPDMISPEMYEEFAYEPEKRLIEAAHRYGLPYLLHICGNTEQILPLMADMGLDAVDIDYKTPLSEIYKHFGNKAPLFGTIDPSGIIALGTPEDVRRETIKILQQYEGNPRLVIGAGCAIPPMAPEANIRMLVKTAKESSTTPQQ